MESGGAAIIAATRPSVRGLPGRALRPGHQGLDDRRARAPPEVIQLVDRGLEHERQLRERPIREREVTLKLRSPRPREFGPTLGRP
jgi:hypothetical protein